MLSLLMDRVFVFLLEYVSIVDILEMEVVNKQIQSFLQLHCKDIWKPRCIARWDELAFATQIQDMEWKITYARKQSEDTDVNTFMNMKQFRNCDWYSCPNGHLYLIGECRLPMAIGKCPTCGVKIGGKSHRMIENNRRLGRVNRNIGAQNVSVDKLSTTLLAGTEDEGHLRKIRSQTPTMTLQDIPTSYKQQRKKEKKCREPKPRREKTKDNSESHLDHPDVDCDMNDLFSYSS